MDPDLEAKYKSLMHRIEHKSVPLSAEHALTTEVEAPLADAKRPADQDLAIKLLYEQSVAFKNELADLRHRIKGLQQSSNKYSAKVDVSAANRYFDRSLRWS